MSIQLTIRELSVIEGVVKEAQQELENRGYVIRNFDVYTRAVCPQNVLALVELIREQRKALEVYAETKNYENDGYHAMTRIAYDRGSAARLALALLK